MVGSYEWLLNDSVFLSTFLNDLTKYWPKVDQGQHGTHSQGKLAHPDYLEILGWHLISTQNIGQFNGHKYLKFQEK